MSINRTDTFSQKSDKNPLYYVKIVTAFWITSFFSTTIHEFGHFMAAYMYNVPINAFSIGPMINGPFGRIGIWQKTIYIKGMNPIKVTLNFLNPFNGCVLLNNIQSVWKMIVIAGMGPLVQTIGMAIPYYFANRHLQTNKREQKPFNPFIYGIFLGSAMGILVGLGNILPIHKSSDGYILHQNLRSIAERRELNQF